MQSHIENLTITKSHIKNFFQKKFLDFAISIVLIK